MPILCASGKEIFPVGIGTFGIASRENSATAERLRLTGNKNVEAVYGNEAAEIDGLVHSLTHGQNYVDTADLYGNGYTNVVIGKALARVAGIIPREDLFISGNVWKSRYDNVGAAVTAMLKRLGVAYLDVAGPHSPHTEGWKTPRWQATMPAFRQLVDAGKIHGLSVSNFTTSMMEEAMELAQLDIITAQMGFSPRYQKEVTQDFRDYCRRNKIQIVAYQPLQPNVIENEVVRGIAQARMATPAQVALAWAIQMDTLPITKTIKPGHIDENIRAVELRLHDSEMRELTALW